MEIKNNDREILERTLTEEEIAFLKNSYSLYKATPDQELQLLLIRRMNDVVSIARYIDMMGNSHSQSLYDYLTERMCNLRIVVDNILHPTTESITFSYVEGFDKTPKILDSMAYLDHQRYPEIASLLKSIAISPEEGETIDGELKRLIGPTHYIVYFYDSNNTVVYDFDKICNPEIKKGASKSIKAMCQKALKKGISPIVQKSFDEMVYQKLNFNIPQHNIGYRLVKKYPEER